MELRESVTLADALTVDERPENTPRMSTLCFLPTTPRGGVSSGTRMPVGEPSVSVSCLDDSFLCSVATSEKRRPMSQAPAATEDEVSLPTRKSSNRPDLLGWVVTCGGVVVLLIGSLPVLVVAIPLGLVVVLLSVIVLSRGKVSGDAAVGYGLAGLVTTLVGLVVALTLTFTPIPDEFARNLDIHFGSTGLGGDAGNYDEQSSAAGRDDKTVPAGQSPVLL